MHGPTPRALLPSNSHRLGSGSAHADGRASASVPRPLLLHHSAPHAGLAPVAICPWRERRLSFHVANRELLGIAKCQSVQNGLQM